CPSASNTSRRETVASFPASNSTKIKPSRPQPRKQSIWSTPIEVSAILLFCGSAIQRARRNYLGIGARAHEMSDDSDGGTVKVGFSTHTQSASSASARELCAFV